MISICIPVYNYEIEALLDKLDISGKKLGLPYEILIADDCSESSTCKSNSIKAKEIGARTIVLKENIGRSAIRNLLAREALYNNLLFLDCDSDIISDEFLTNYKKYLNTNMVVYGGRLYSESKPLKEYRLHWNYGRKREIKPVEVRNSFPAGYFQSNNFLSSKEVFLKHPLNEHIKNYGHEDTLLGIDFFQNDIPVIHIENPVLHMGLEKEDEFLKKMESGLKNLCLIYNMNIDHHILRKHIKILNVFSQIRKLKATGLITFIWLLSRYILLFCIKKFYSLTALDFYKIGYLCFIYKDKDEY